MHHATARLVISRILSGDGFGERAVTLVQAALLHNQSDCPTDLQPRVLERCLALPVDAAAPYSHPLNQQPVPAEAGDLCLQLSPALIAHPGNPALASASLWALAMLWPHVGADERPQLRTCLLNGLASRRGEGVEVLTSLQLRDWQKKVPTSYGTQSPSVASLRGILETPDPLAAYLLLAEHLGMAVDLETLCWVLGSLAVTLAQTHHDRSGRIAGLLQGLAACERLVPLVPAEQLVTVISQITHRIWWLRAHGHLHPVRISLDQSARPYGPALRSGDITLAQRAGRTLASQHPGSFWEESWRVASEFLLGDGRDLPRILAMIDAAHWRAGDGLVSGDDAAAIAGVLADAVYRQTHGKPN